jgi:hypothetical protein
MISGNPLHLNPVDIIQILLQKNLFGEVIQFNSLLSTSLFHLFASPQLNAILFYENHQTENFVNQSRRSKKAIEKA